MKISITSATFLITQSSCYRNAADFEDVTTQCHFLLESMTDTYTPCCVVVQQLPNPIQEPHMKLLTASKVETITQRFPIYFALLVGGVMMKEVKNGVQLSSCFALR